MPDNYQAEDDANTLLRAREVRNDPIRLRAALDCIAGKIAAMNEVQAESGEDTGEGE